MHFEKPGRENTVKTVEIALEGARREGIDTIVISSNSGYSLGELLRLDTTGLNIVCVTHMSGFHSPGEQEFPAQLRGELERKGIRFFTGGHSLSGGERGISRKFGGNYPLELIAATLRMFSQGVKVAVECSVMALDGGLIRPGVPVVAIGGTGGGVDTAIVLRPAHSNDILDCKIDKILCKPLLEENQ